MAVWINVLVFIPIGPDAGNFQVVFVIRDCVNCRRLLVDCHHCFVNFYFCPCDGDWVDVDKTVQVIIFAPITNAVLCA